MIPEVEVMVVGAGPHGLATATHLQAEQPDRRRRGDLMVVDPTGQWMVAWKQRFSAYAIPYLRSPGVHGPDPDPSAIFAFAQRTGRLDELADPFAVPTTHLFADHCADVAARHDLDGAVEPAAVVSVEPRDGAAKVELNDGTRLTARRVVLAGNPARAHLPEWAQQLGGIHAGDLDVRHLAPLTGEHVVVVGGGLTAVHLALAAAERGARVTLACRRTLVERIFDTDPGWLGPKYLDGFVAEADPAVRRKLIDEARGGGTVPPRWLARLVATPDISVVADDPEALVRSAPPDRLWCATGWTYDAGTDPLLAGLRRRCPLPLHRGLPELDAHLTWPSTTVHCLGAYAALRLGPTALNLAGARTGAAAVASASAAYHR